MSEDHFQAVCELALEMKWLDAAKFIRAETGTSLRDARHTVEWLAGQNPSSPIGMSWAEHQDFYASQTWSRP